MGKNEGFKKRDIEEACSRETHREDNEDFRECGSFRRNTQIRCLYFLSTSIFL